MRALCSDQRQGIFRRADLFLEPASAAFLKTMWSSCALSNYCL